MDDTEQKNNYFHIAIGLASAFVPAKWMSQQAFACANETKCAAVRWRMLGGWFLFFFLVTISVFHLNPMLQINQQITCFPFVSLVWHIGQKSGKQICRCFVLEIKTRTLTSTSVSWNVYRTNITRLLSKLCMFYRNLNKINKFPKWCLGKCYLIPFST